LSGKEKSKNKEYEKCKQILFPIWAKLGERNFLVDVRYINEKEK